jgi:signal transduction histidine kinase
MHEAPSVPTVPAAENVLFRNLPPSILASENISLKTREFAQGESVFAEGDAGDYCYLVESGAVRLTKTSSSGVEEFLAMVDPGGFFGELALYDDSPRVAHARAAVPSRLVLLDRAGFETLRRAAPLEMMSTLAEVNITRVRQANALLVKNLAEAGRLKEIGGELSTIAHNLRGPLATIRNAADTLEMLTTEGGSDPSKLAKFVKMIQDTADGALSDIDYLMARLRGDAPAERVLVRVSDLLADVRKRVGVFVHRPGVTYDDSQMEYDGPVRVDSREWAGALTNLVKNAVEALPDHGGHVWVCVRTEGREVVFTVQDNGKGVPAEMLGRFFDRGITRGKSRGTGLGTAHVQSVVEAHRGRATVSSTLGVGTTVEMRLPLEIS